MSIVVGFRVSETVNKALTELAGDQTVSAYVKAMVEELVQPVNSTIESVNTPDKDDLTRRD